MSEEAQIYTRQGFGHAMGMGERPALLVVDFVNGFNDPALFGGGNIGPAIERTVPLLEACRSLGLPIAHSRIVFAADGSDHNVWVRKIPTLAQLTEDNPASHIVPQLAPRRGEYVVRKRTASAFAGTDLAAWYAMRGVDTLIVAGCTTSGCIRASVIDALAAGFRPLVPNDCVGDRALGPHDANLFDLQQKYADVLPSADVLTQLRARRAA